MKSVKDGTEFSMLPPCLVPIPPPRVNRDKKKKKLHSSNEQ